MWPRPPAPITTHLVPAPSTGIAFLTAWIAVSPASASAAICVGCSDGSSLTTERALVGADSAKPPSRSMPGNEPFVAVHVVAAPAGAAQPARDERVADDRVADLDVGDAGADLVDPAGVLVAGDVGQLDAGLLRPLAFLDVQIGAAEAGGADLDDDVERTRIFGSSICSTLSASWYLCKRAAFMRPPPPRSGLQQVAAHAAVGLQGQRQARTRRTAQIVGAERRAVAGHEGRRVVGGVEPERAARSCGSASGASRSATARRARVGRRTGARAQPSLARQQRLALEQLAQASSSGAVGLARERVVEGLARLRPRR